MDDQLVQRRTISIRLSERLATDLSKAAAKEANPESVVARRLIATGLLREKRLADRESAEQSR
jgi:hypothetical protein